ncbi:outer membrane beta-barrel family protein [Mucilaginibacter lappiensis]|uniref:Outer membrane protein beta-barrel domain-containing protein n=1 Tax=Mucilaginibacter lappiensis TaxID=354630 RepID=A0A841J8K9_9SPHI|nr:outer membrane beta-barrel family protein [Mucilaginibacter lappiensis]MBB6127423.1 hypothetical protein [Mucilaginibacter lappiensis]
MADYKYKRLSCHMFYLTNNIKWIIQVILKSVAVSSILLLYLLICPVNVLAQTAGKSSIEGTVVDDKNLPLPGATVVLTKINDSVAYKITQCKIDGKFIFYNVVSGGYQVEVRMVGFKTLMKSNIQLVDTLYQLGSLKLSPESKMLNEVLVKYRQPVIDRQIDKTVVNIDKSVLSVGASVLEIMGKLPGVRVSQDGQISLNGKSVSVFMDGKASLLTPDALANLLRGMSSSDIQKIELMPQSSAKYDAAGGGGVINIIKKKNQDDGFSANVNIGAGFGEYGRYNSGFNLSVKGSGSALYINSGFLSNKFFGKSTSSSDFYSKDGLLSSKLLSSDKNINVDKSASPSIGLDIFLTKQTTMSISGSSSFQNFNKNIVAHTNRFNTNDLNLDNTDLLNNSDTKSKNYSGGINLLSHLDTLGKDFSINIDYSRYISNFNQNNDYSFYTQQSEPTLDRTFLMQGSGLNIYSIKSDFYLPLRSGARLELGVKSSLVNAKYNNNYTDSSIVQNDNFNYRENIDAGYVNWNKKFAKLSMQFGLRAEYTNGTGELISTGEKINNKYFQLFPSAFFNYKFNDNNTLNLSTNKKVNRPTYANLNPQIIILNSTTNFQGTPSLLPVTAYNSSLTYSYKDEFYAIFSYSFWKNDFTNWLFPSSDQTSTTIKQLNNKYTKYLNLTISNTKSITKWWTNTNTLNFYKQPFKGVFNGIDIYDSGAFSFDVETNNSFSFNQWSLEFTFTYEGRYQNINRITEPRYNLNLGLKRLIGNRGSFAINCNDLLNTFKDNYLLNSVAVKTLSNNRYDTRYVRATFSYQFGNTKNKKRDVSDGAAEEKNRSGGVKIK